MHLQFFPLMVFFIRLLPQAQYAGFHSIQKKKKKNQQALVYFILETAIMRIK